MYRDFVETSPFTEFGLILGLAAILGYVASKLKQPPILGYILTGLIIGPLTPFFNPEKENIELLAQVGVTFLLFTLGLELNISELRKLGKVAFATGLGQIFFTSIIGYVLCILMGFSASASLYISIALTFSSTIVIVKLLSQKNELDTLWGRISIGFLLVQDFIAILILIILSAMASIEATDAFAIINSVGQAILKGTIAIGFIYAFVKLILYPVLNSLRLEKEVLFLLAIAWAVCLAVIMGPDVLGFTYEVGGLIAGIALSNRFENLQIESWTKPLRDFFLALFFVILGTHVELGSMNEAIIPALIFSFFVIVGNPIIVMIIMSLLGYSKKVSFMTSLAVGQISEFSLILINFAYNPPLNLVDNKTLTMMTLIGGITMIISSYLIFYSDIVYEKLKNFLNIFDFKVKKVNESEILAGDQIYETIIFGCHRMGKSILNLVPELKNNSLIIDYDPKNVKDLIQKGYNAIYGEIGDIDLYDKFKVDTARIIISTVPSLKENTKLINHFKSIVNKPMIIVAANETASAKDLYNIGADFVVYPQLLGGELISSIVRKKTLSKSHVNKRTRNIESLAVLGEGM